MYVRTYQNTNGNVTVTEERTDRGCCAKKDPQRHLLNKNVELAHAQTSKGWFIVAIVVGSLVVIGVGGFGALGLLQTHGAVSLPQWLASSIGTVGTTPQAWGLWVMGVGGIVVGGGLIIFGSVKVHQIRKAEEALRNLSKLRHDFGDVQEHEKRAATFFGQPTNFNESTIYDVR